MVAYCKPMLWNKYISELGYDSELISYKRENIKPLYLPPQQTKMQKLVKMGIAEVVWRVYSKIVTRFFAKAVFRMLEFAYRKSIGI